MLRDGRCFHLCFLVSAVTCGKIPGVPTFLSAFPPPLLNHNGCRAAPVNTHTHTQSQTCCPCTFGFDNLKRIPEQTSGEQNSGDLSSVQSRPACERYIASSVLMMKPCVQMNEAFSVVVNHIKEAPMMTNALQSETNKRLRGN